MTDAWNQSWRAAMAEQFGSEGFEMCESLEERAKSIVNSMAYRDPAANFWDVVEGEILAALKEAEARGRQRGLEEAALDLETDPSNYWQFGVDAQKVVRFLRTLAQEPEKP